MKLVGDLPNGIQLVDSSWISTDEIKGWIDECRENHASCNLSSSFTTKTPPLLLVDVLAQCLVSPKAPISYLALSYVWGQTEPFQLTSTNLATLKIRDGFAEERVHIPRTIRDAMVATEQLGFQYLWVDSLCIVQDDEEEKLRQINNMAIIYSQACITIVAADGDAEYGLRGVKSCLPRSVQQDIIPIPPMGNLVAFAGSIATQTLPACFSRGWTFQEYMLSPRLLVFMRDTVMWKCSEYNRTEGHHSGLPAYLPDSYFPIDGRWPDMGTYTSLVLDYNNRNLTHDSDALSAFSGVLQRLNTGFPGGFVQALPEFYFDLALLWQPKEGVALRRRAAGLDRHPHPSWSWVGWHGCLDIYAWHNRTIGWLSVGPWPMIRTSSICTWYKTTSPSSQRLRIDNSFHLYYELCLPGCLEDLHDTDSLQERMSTGSLNLAGWTVRDKQHPMETSEDSENAFGANANTDEDPLYHHEKLDQLVIHPLPYKQGHSELQSHKFYYLWFQSHRARFYRGNPIKSGLLDEHVSTLSVTLLDSDEALSGVLRPNM